VAVINHVKYVDGHGENAYRTYSETNQSAETDYGHDASYEMNEEEEEEGLMDANDNMGDMQEPYQEEEEDIYENSEHLGKQKLPSCHRRQMSNQQC
jgi:hypothetical protein